MRKPSWLCIVSCCHPTTEEAQTRGPSTCQRISKLVMKDPTVVQAFSQGTPSRRGASGPKVSQRSFCRLEVGSSIWTAPDNSRSTLGAAAERRLGGQPKKCQIWGFHAWVRAKEGVAGQFDTLQGRPKLLSTWANPAVSLKPSLANGIGPGAGRKGPHGVTPNSDILWMADGAMVGQGWRLGRTPGQRL